MTREMKVAPIESAAKWTQSYETTETVTGTGVWHIVPAGINMLMVQLSPAPTGSGYIEATIDRIDTVKNGVPSTVIWPYGTVSSTTQDVAYPVTAFRAIVTSGTMTLSAKAQ